MSNTPPIALLVMFAAAAVGAVVLYFVIGPGRGVDPVPSAQAQIQVVGADGEPRAGVYLMVRRNAAARAIVLPASGATGEVEIRLPIGRYEVRVYPKKLATAAQRDAFLTQRRLEFKDLWQFQLRVGSLHVTPNQSDPVVLRLPVQTAY